MHAAHHHQHGSKHAASKLPAPAGAVGCSSSRACSQALSPAPELQPLQVGDTNKLTSGCTSLAGPNCQGIPVNFSSNCLMNSKCYGQSWRLAWLHRMICTSTWCYQQGVAHNRNNYVKQSPPPSAPLQPLGEREGGGAPEGGGPKQRVA